MTVPTLLRHLPHFAAAPRVTPRPATAEPVRPAPQPAAHPAGAAPLYTAEDVARAAAEARAAALAEAEAERSACAQALADAEAMFATRLDTELAHARAAWCAAEGERLAGALGAGLAALEARICEGVAAVLRPFLREKARERAVESFARRVGDLLRHPGATPALTICGPADLLIALRARLPETAGISFAEAPGPELRVTCEDTVLETQMAAWTGGAAEGGAHGRQG